MPQNPIIAVAGATGAQGGGLARAILADPARPFDVRALTRDPSNNPPAEPGAFGCEPLKAAGGVANAAP